MVRVFYISLTVAAGLYTLDKGADLIRVLMVSGF